MNTCGQCGSTFTPDTFHKCEPASLEDTARLDWMDMAALPVPAGHDIRLEYRRGKWHVYGVSGTVAEPRIRDAIDKAKAAIASRAQTSAADD